MFFKNLYFYHLPDDFSIDAASLTAKMAEKLFRPCGAQESTTFGFSSPFSEGGELVISHERCLLLCARRETKILPSTVVNDHLNIKIAEIEEKEDRKVRRKEKLALKDDITFDLLPRAFSRFQQTYGYFDLSNQLLVIDSASAQKAEDFCSLLRETLGSLPTKLVSTAISPAAVMTQWLQDKNLPQGFLLGNDAELKEPKPEGATLRCKQEDLGSDEVTAHVNSGKQALKLGINFNHRLTCMIQDDLGIKRLKFTDLVIDDSNNAAESDESADAQNMADFAIMSAELGVFIPALLDAMGGKQMIGAQ